jgi:hypothetical protein
MQMRFSNSHDRWVPAMLARAILSNRPKRYLAVFLALQAQTLSVMSDLSMKQDVFISASIKTSLKAILEIFDRVITML